MIADIQQLIRPGLDIFIDDGMESAEAIVRTTHLGIGAHQDDLEFMALHGILECYKHPQKWFGGITCGDGSGSPRSGDYADCSDEEMMELRRAEQRAAAGIGEYSFMAQLGYASSEIKSSKSRVQLVDELEAWILASAPQFLYTHNPFDKHPAHLAVLCAVMDALARIAPETRPLQVWGCEVWRGLDWLPDGWKQAHPVDGHEVMAAKLCGVFKSQISGGKRYDLAVEGRRLANATFSDSHSVDVVKKVSYAIDLTSVCGGGSAALRPFMENVLRQFEDELTGGLDMAGYQ